MFMVSKVSFLLIPSLPSVASSASNLRFKTSNPTKKTKNFSDLQKSYHRLQIQHILKAYKILKVW